VEAPAVALRFVAPKFLKVRVGDKPPNTMTDVKLLDIVLALAAILGALRIWYFVRSRAMRRLASKWDFRYIGPTAPPRWWDISAQRFALLFRVGLAPVSPKLGTLSRENTAAEGFLFSTASQAATAVSLEPRSPAKPNKIHSL
jgi:hypothetical protein